MEVVGDLAADRIDAPLSHPPPRVGHSPERGEHVLVVDGRRVGPVLLPHHHRHIARLAVRDPADVVLVVPRRHRRRLAQLALRSHDRDSTVARVDDPPATTVRRDTGYVVVPDSGHGPGVLVLHAWWGLTPFFRHLCDRLADEGFVALAPDLFAGATADTPGEGAALLGAADPNDLARLVMASAKTLRGLPATPEGPIGVLGFSMGASMALWLSVRAPDDVGAAAVFYGTQDMDFAPAKAVYQGHFAQNDAQVSEDEVAYLQAQLRLAGRDVTFYRYPGAGHWFFEEDREDSFDRLAASEAWQRTVEFLRQHLPEG
jgi:carboxymethylenebutenolidase